MTEIQPTFITRVVLKNYKSIAACDVQLGPLTFLVGPNGSGKSNFIDALRFVSDALSTSLGHALRERGGLNEVRRRSSGHARDFGIRLEFRLRDGSYGHYALRIGAERSRGFEVKDEECFIQSVDYHIEARRFVDGESSAFRVKDDHVVLDGGTKIEAPRDRLFLPIAPYGDFWALARAITDAGFYNLNPSEMRNFQPREAPTILTRDGSNIASIVNRLARDQPGVIERIEEYLTQITPGVCAVASKAYGDRAMLEFRQNVQGAKDSWRFPANSMSDGTLRALGILVALFQTRRQTTGEWPTDVPLVAVEEPETALHPAGAGILFDALREASAWRQVLVTSHSPDLLDNKDVDTDSILAVVAESGETRLGPVEEVGRSALRDHLYTVGELLRMDQLRPATPTGKGTSRVRLFSDGAA